MIKRKKGESRKTLFDLSREFSEFEDLIGNLDGDLSPEDTAKLETLLTEMNKDRDNKFDGYLGLIASLNNRCDARKKEAERLSKLAKTDENKIKRLKWCLLNFMTLHNLETVETVKYRLSRSLNASAPVVLDKYYEENPAELEERFRTVTFKPNLQEIAKALKDGETLDFAKFGNRGENLKIK